MFNLSQTCAIDIPIFKLDHIMFTSPSLNLVIRQNNQLLFDKPRKDSATLLKDSYLELDLSITHKAGDVTRYADDDHIRLVYFIPDALFHE